MTKSSGSPIKHDVQRRLRYVRPPMSQKSLKQSLGLRDALAVVIGSVIGTGIFLKAAVMTQDLHSGFWVIMAWLAAGLLSLLGAMTFAELGTLFPQAGGGYVYAREAFGRLPAFLYGWVSLCIIGPGSVAAYGVAAATFLNGVLPLGPLTALTPILFILVFTFLNCLAISFGGAVQSFLTALKIILILGLGLSIFIFTPATAATGFANFFDGSLRLESFGAAVLAALWAFDGWDGITRVASEVKSPQKNIPRALILGLLAVFGIYLLANLAYFWALPASEVASSNSTAFPNALPIATKATFSFLGERGVQIISTIFVISALGAMNGSIMTNARVPFAMARDGLLFSSLGFISSKTHVPLIAILVQGALAIALAISGTFDQLTDYVVFSAWIFYGLSGISLFVFRKKHPDKVRAYHVPGYPFIPAAFVGLTVLLLTNTLLSSPVESAIGLGFMVSGIPIYYWMCKKYD